MIYLFTFKFDYRIFYNIYFSNITETLPPQHEISRRRPQNLGKFRTKNEQQRMYSSKRCHICVSSSGISVHEICGNLGPKKFAGPEILDQRKSLRFSLIFTLRGFPFSGRYVRRFAPAYGWSLFLVPNFPKFWTKILQGQPKKNCRRVRTLAMEAIGLGLDSHLQHALPSGTPVSRVESATPAYCFQHAFSILCIEKPSIADWLPSWLAASILLAGRLAGI